MSEKKWDKELGRILACMGRGSIQEGFSFSFRADGKAMTVEWEGDAVTSLTAEGLVKGMINLFFHGQTLDEYYAELPYLNGEE